MSKIRTPLLIGLICGASMLVFFQNCANQRLEKVIPQPPSYEAPVLSLKSEFCPMAKEGSAGTTKFVFIIDLSASNFGDWTKEVVSGQNTFYWDPTLGTDPNGTRFDSIKAFVDTCGVSSSNRFSVIGFSASAGALSGSNFSCTNSTFLSGSQLKTQLDALKARQAQDEIWYKKWTKPNYLTEATPDNLIFRVTSYTSASECLENLIVNDLNSESIADRYNVFFISDGKPEDKSGTGCNLSNLTAQEKESCYLESVFQSLTFAKTAALSKGKNFTLGGIYYGKDGVIPDVLSEISKEGGVPDVTKIDSFDSGENSICKLVVTQFTTEFRPDSYVITPLTTIRKNGLLQADSDMDGVTDIEEQKQGSDPTNPRSMVEGVLDGICRTLGGLDKCVEKRQSLSCDPNLFNNAYLTDCDYKVSGLNLLPSVGDWGIDSDQDGFSDYLEIIKGLNPAKPDLLIDTDGDGVSNKEEILKGTDPFTPDSELLLTIINQVENGFSYDTFDPVCPLGAYSVALKRMQVVPVLETPKHAKNEHIVLIQVRYLPTNSVDAKRSYYGAQVPVKLNIIDKAETLSTDIQNIPQSYLLKWGETGGL